jgi:hypothetical protein
MHVYVRYLPLSSCCDLLCNSSFCGTFCIDELFIEYCEAIFFDLSIVKVLKSTLPFAGLQDFLQFSVVHSFFVFMIAKTIVIVIEHNTYLNLPALPFRFRYPLPREMLPENDRLFETIKWLFALVFACSNQILNFQNCPLRQLFYIR